MNTLMYPAVVLCPNHEGNLDCTPFCKLCEGSQETDLETLLNHTWSISWDGCHKIYLNMDLGQHEKMIGYGYDRTILNADPYITKQKVEEWYEDSCSLRFIDAVFTEPDDTDRFVTIVAQMFE